MTVDMPGKANTVPRRTATLRTLESRISVIETLLEDAATLDTLETRAHALANALTRLDAALLTAEARVAAVTAQSLDRAGE